MPAEQQGSVYKTSRGYGLRWYDEMGARPEIAAWTRKLPEGSRYGIVQAFRQTLEAAVRWGLIGTNPAKLAGRNPQPKRDEVEHFDPTRSSGSPSSLGRCTGRSSSSPPTRGFAPRSGRHSSGGTSTGTRACCVSSARSPTARQGAEDEGMPSARAAPRSGGSGARARPATSGHPARLPRPSRRAHRPRNWRKREWKPALEAAGLPRERRACMTCATRTPRGHSPPESQSYDVARYMGTSVRMLDLTYAHLVKGSEAVAVSRLDAYTAGSADRLGQESAT